MSEHLYDQAGSDTAAVRPGVSQAHPARPSTSLCGHEPGNPVCHGAKWPDFSTTLECRPGRQTAGILSVHLGHHGAVHKSLFGWFKSQLPHFWSSSVLMSPGGQRGRFQGSGPCPAQGRAEGLSAPGLVWPRPTCCGHVGEGTCAWKAPLSASASLWLSNK